MLTQKTFWFSLIGLCLSWQLSSQEYTVSSFLFPSVDGTYRPFTTTDGVANYKNTTANVYLFRTGGIWFFSDQPNLSGNIIDFEDNNTPSPPIGTWLSGTVVDIILPVEWGHFFVKSRANEVVLEWKTLFESNNSGFAIERSQDGRTFESIAWVEGFGTTQQESTYSYLDQQVPVVPILYYRLQQVDFDGTQSYSEVISVQRQLSPAFKIYPTVLRGDDPSMRLLGSSLLEGYRVIDMTGRILLSRQPSSTLPTELDLPSLATGQYYLVLSSAGHHQTLPFFIVNR